MSKDIKEFPDLSNKLTAPTKKSLFERQKAEAEAKRAREEAETAAVYKDFVASFEDEDEEDVLSKLGGIGKSHTATRGGFGAGGGGPKRHFAPSGPKSLNSGPGSLGPAPPSRKRPFEGAFQTQRDRERDRGVLGFEDKSGVHVGLDASAAFQHSDDEEDMRKEEREEEKAAPKPTLQLTQLPPGTSPAVIKAIIPTNLTVDNIKVVPPGVSSSTERRTMAAIVTLAKDTPASDIDTAVSGLQNRYLGYGFYLNISRHLSSAALGGSVGFSGLSATPASLPFGAKAVQQGPGHALNRAPPPGMRGQFAPPSNYNTASNQFNRGPESVQVSVKPPSDIKQLKLIHKTVEALLTHGPEFEALLMNRHEVQQDEKWAWIWDSRSAGGVWYRWRLWQVLSGSGMDAKRRANIPSRLFDVGAPWQQPDRDDALMFEWTTAFHEFISDDDYNSSDEEDSDDEGRRRRMQQHERAGGPPDLANIQQESEKSYLNPLQRAKLTHLLSRLPATTAKLRKGDVARVTAFAISHAGAGADEVVDMIVSNVEKPLRWTGANTDVSVDKEEAFDGDDVVPSSELQDRDDKKGEDQDQTSSKLIALYLISDILSSSSTSGVRHAWRYRQLFENALKQRNIFAKLGRLERDLKWGRLRAEKWKRSVDNVLRLWEGWSAFQQEAQKDFVNAFSNPPLTEREQRVEEERQQERSQRESASMSKWKSLDETGKSASDAGVATEQEMTDIDRHEAASNSDAELHTLPIVEDSDGEPLADEDLDGEPMDDSDAEAGPAGDTDTVMSDVKDSGGNRHAEPKGEVDQNPAVRARRQRPRAVDMFADSDRE